MWIKHDGKVRPMSSSTVVDLKYRNTEILKNTKAGIHRWIHARNTARPHRCFKEYDIMEYKLTSV